MKGEIENKTFTNRLKKPSKTNSLNDFTDFLNEEKISHKSLKKETISSEKTNIILQKKKRDRRLKDMKDERNYICGCGKSYLSYAALYTHAKTKHEGVFPDGTTNLQKKNNDNKVKDDWNIDNINCDYEKTYRFNQNFREFIKRIEGGVLEKNLHQDLIEEFPCDIFSNKVQYEKLLVNIQKIRMEMIENYGGNFLKQIDIIIFEINNSKSLNCNQIFAIFLIYIFRFISIKFYKELVFFIICYRDLLNKKGWEKYNETTEDDDVDISKEFCETNGAELIPDFSNIFIMDYFSGYIEDNNIVKSSSVFHFFGFDSEKLLSVILIIENFCKWLHVHKFTSATVEIYKD